MRALTAEYPFNSLEVEEKIYQEELRFFDVYSGKGEPSAIFDPRSGRILDSDSEGEIQDFHGISLKAATLDRSMIRGNIVSHYHPHYESFSKKDWINMAYAGPPLELRVVTDKYLYVMRNLLGNLSHEDFKDNLAVRSLWFECRKEIKCRKEEDSNRHLIWLYLSSKTGLVYGRYSHNQMAKLLAL